MQNDPKFTRLIRLEKNGSFNKKLKISRRNVAKNAKKTGQNMGENVSTSNKCTKKKCKKGEEFRKKMNNKFFAKHIPPCTIAYCLPIPLVNGREKVQKYTRQ